MTTLLYELNLVKIFDTLWASNFSYIVISLAMFALGLAGIYTTLSPIRADALGNKILPILCVLFGLSILGTLLIINHFPFDIVNMGKKPWLVVLDIPIPLSIRNIFITIGYITVPFFISGLILTTLFSNYAKDIQRLYFYDLVGASIGCVIIIPLLPLVAPEGLIILAAGLCLLAAALFRLTKFTLLLAAVGIVLGAYPFTQDNYFSLELQSDKRQIKQFKQKTELTHWDPIARVDIIDFRGKPDEPEGIKWIAYDGGSQTSYFYKFDGNFQKIRDDVNNGLSDQHFWGNVVIASHLLKKDTNQDVLVIGSAGGQEMTAALTYGAKSVDGVELVGKVVDLGKQEYAEYTGNVFNHPKVNAQKGEGRSFLRSTDKKYDIIQIMSNHTSSSIAAGSAAADPTYLQTKEAYLEYFSHLKDDGVLHVNHHVYNRMLATAATAWKEMDRGDFYPHVLVLMVPGTQDNLPTFMVKMTPWIQAEIDVLDTLLRHSRVFVNPLEPSDNPLFQRLMRGELTKQDLASTAYQVRPTTDDHPYFNLLRKTNQDVVADPENLLDKSTARLLNSQRKAGIPMDVMHLYIVGAGASVFALLVFLIPLLFSKVGRAPWPNKLPTLSYFSLLGLGFILFELVSIHLLMRLIGYPLYTLTTVIFGYLIGAGIGSLASEKMGISPRRRWRVPFVGILITSILMLIIHPFIIDSFLPYAQWVRITAALVLVLPIAFFLGMAFPLGVLRVSQTPYAQQAIAWAWGINGVFTVIGSFLSAVLSIYFGFTITLCVAILCYLAAMLVFRKLTLSERY